MSFFDEFGGERNFNLVGKDDAMKAAQYQGSQRVRVIEKSLRSLGDGEILLNVDVCGICGTDVHIVEGTSRSSPPVILGHEFSGEIVNRIFHQLRWVRLEDLPSYDFLAADRSLIRDLAAGKLL